MEYLMVIYWEGVKSYAQIDGRETGGRPSCFRIG